LSAGSGVERNVRIGPKTSPRIAGAIGYARKIGLIILVAFKFGERPEVQMS
jgi:hypothetical protein